MYFKSTSIQICFLINFVYVPKHLHITKCPLLIAQVMLSLIKVNILFTKEQIQIR